MFLNTAHLPIKSFRNDIHSPLISYLKWSSCAHTVATSPIDSVRAEDDASVVTLAAAASEWRSDPVQIKARQAAGQLVDEQNERQLVR